MAEESRRVQFDLSDEHLAEVDVMQADCDVATRKELLKAALDAFKWMVAARKQGREILSSETDGTKAERFTMPSLERAGRAR